MTSLRIGAVDVRVETAVLEDSLGEYRSDPVPTIRLHHDLEEPVRSLTEIHEIAHAISDQYALGLSENCVRRLETALGQFLRDNPGTVMRLLEALRRP